MSAKPPAASLNYIETDIRPGMTIDDYRAARGRDRAQPRREAVCVTREHELQHGRGELAGGRHRVYLATLEHTARGWGVSRWQPQP